MQNIYGFEDVLYKKNWEQSCRNNQRLHFYTAARSSIKVKTKKRRVNYLDNF